MGEIKKRIEDEITEKNHVAATRIQKMWRNRTAEKLLKLAIGAKRRNQLIMIQKFMRGYIVNLQIIS